MQRYFAAVDMEELVDLGMCRDFCEASDKAEADGGPVSGNVNWIFSEEDLRAFIHKALLAVNFAPAPQGEANGD